MFQDLQEKKQFLQVKICSKNVVQLISCRIIFERIINDITSGKINSLYFQNDLFCLFFVWKNNKIQRKKPQMKCSWRNENDKFLFHFLRFWWLLCPSHLKQSQRGKEDILVNFQERHLLFHQGDQFLKTKTKNKNKKWKWKIEWEND